MIPKFLAWETHPKVIEGEHIRKQTNKKRKQQQIQKHFIGKRKKLGKQ